MASRAHDISMSRWLLVLAAPLTSAAGGGGEHKEGTAHCVTADQGSIAWGQTNETLRLNLDEQEMPEDLDYKRKVQLLLENRQRNAEHLWGARAAPSVEPATTSALNNNEQFIGSKNS